MTLVLCWDIDGTLLSTARAGIFAWEDAVRDVLGKEISLTDYPTAGLTDVEIAGLLTRETGSSSDPAVVTSLVQRYGELLPSRLHYRQGEVLPGVREILTAVRERPDVLSILLTGNTAAGARAKLAHYGLTDFFEHGAFADRAPDRPAIAARAAEIARGLVGDVASECIYVIGDTPHDISCGKAIGARTVAVATGSYDVEALAAHSPWWLLSVLPSPSEFLAHVEGG